MRESSIHGLNFDDRRLWRAVFIIAFVCRAICSIRLSYLHPDEHLQGPQIIAHGWFGWATETPWEFTDENPVRSFVPLWLMYGIPMSFFGHKDDADPIHVLYTIRLLLAVLTWILEDMAVDRLSRNANDKLRSLLFLSTSYVTWTWQCHTLSNSLETILVLWYLVILHEFERGDVVDRHWDGFLLGIMTVVGIFNRPTFIAFILLPALNLGNFFARDKFTAVTFLIGFAATASCCIYVDTSLYGKSEWVIAPLNNFLFNSSASNLAEHGIHSRWTHLLVNIPQLLGPGVLLLRPKWKELPMQSVISALAMLSYIPHQEARFLIPIIPLLATQMDLTQFNKRYRGVLLGMWFLFNVLAGGLMGFLHQSGVIPAQIYLRQDIELPCTVIWWKTYTPPLWVTGFPDNLVQYAELSDRGEDLPGILNFVSAPSTNSMTVVDLLGAPESALDQTVLAARNASNIRVYVVSPLANAAASREDKLVFAHKPIWTDNLHISLEHFDWGHPSNWRLGLGIFDVST